ncbi:uncharacterized protein [Musca autumnalis]|uniref:uncharacterized protein n=1 Tax=Musca autumnalis TaxID=221902 RepID=UPI003CEBF709
MSVREQLSAHLKQMGVDFPDTASIQQLRALLNGFIGAGPSTSLVLQPEDGSTAQQQNDKQLEQQELRQPENGQAQAKPAQQQHGEQQEQPVLRQPTNESAPTHIQTVTSVPSTPLEQQETDEPVTILTSPTGTPKQTQTEQVKRLQTKLNMLRLEDEIDELQMKKEKKRSVATFADVEGALPKFTGDDGYAVTKWVAEFQKVTNVLDCTAAEKFIFARRMLAGSAGLFLRATKAKSWKELKEELCNEFQKTIGTKEILRKLECRKWQKSKESLHRYALEMQELADGAPITEAEKVEFIVEGIQDKSTAALIFLNTTTIAGFKRLIPMYEKMVAEKTQRQIRSGTINPGMNEVQCYKCRGVGHYASNCKKIQQPTGACFKCGRSGHWKTNCPLGVVGTVPEEEVDWNMQPMQLRQPEDN